MRIFLFTIIAALALAGCKKEECQICTKTISVMDVSNPQGRITTQQQFEACGDELEEVDGTSSFMTTDVNGFIELEVRYTVCK